MCVPHKWNSCSSKMHNTTLVLNNSMEKPLRLALFKLTRCDKTKYESTYLCQEQIVNFVYFLFPSFLFNYTCFGLFISDCFISAAS